MRKGLKASLLVAFVLFSQSASAGLFGALKVPFKHPFASAILLAGGYMTVKAYCSAGAPATQIDDGTGALRMVKIDCNTVGSEIENKLGDWSERINGSDGVLEHIKTAVATSNTKELRKSLNVVQVANGMPPDPGDCDAHHIVPKNEARPWAAKAARAARDAIDGCVDIDSAANGIYLPNKPDGNSQCNGSYHKTLHTKTYYLGIAERLVQARINGGCDELRRELSTIKQLLRAGTI